jgi:hypothetical protein
MRLPGFSKLDCVASICLCYVENVSKARLDYIFRKLSRKAPKALIVVCLLANDEKIAALKTPSRLGR